jgi:hypothetical protein
MVMRRGQRGHFAVPAAFLLIIWESGIGMLMCSAALGSSKALRRGAAAPPASRFQSAASRRHQLHNRSDRRPPLGSPSVYPYVPKAKRSSAPNSQGHGLAMQRTVIIFGSLSRPMMQASFRICGLYPRAHGPRLARHWHSAGSGRHRSLG